jgi:hypothetical protein
MATQTRSQVIEDFKTKYFKFLDTLKELSKRRFENPEADMTMEIWRFQKIVVDPMEVSYQKLSDAEKQRFIEVIFGRFDAKQVDDRGKES